MLSTQRTRVDRNVCQFIPYITIMNCDYKLFLSLRVIKLRLPEIIKYIGAANKDYYAYSSFEISIF